MTKQELRRWVRNELKTHASCELQRLSDETCRLILRHRLIQQAQTVLAFWPLPDEPDIRPAVRQLYQQGKTVLLPHVVSDTEMVICRYEGDESLAEGAFGILEPHVNVSSQKAANNVLSQDNAVNRTISRSPSSTDNAPSTTAVALIPGRAFDAEGHRLGRGKGYYDRFLALNADIQTIGICYPFQIIDEIPSDTHDIIINELLWKISK